MTDSTPSGPVLLVVCTANVCRSPLVQSVLSRRLAAGPLADAVVVSAGTRATPEQAMCDVSDAEAGDDGFAHLHRSRPLDPAVVAAADLVVTAEREHRGAVVRSAPGSQSRVFTIAEAAALAAIAAQRVADGEVPRPTDLREVAALLHASRGRIPMPEPEPARRGLFRRRREEPAADPLDLVDGHGLAPAVHAAAVRRTHERAEALADGLLALLGGSAERAADQPVAGAPM
ncbi:MAG: hypothetical protein ACTHJL_07650 [Amnibacterium sp.]